MGMPVSPLCDRDTTDWRKSQIVFLDCVVRLQCCDLNDMLRYLSSALPGLCAERARLSRCTASLSMHSSMHQPIWHRLPAQVHTPPACISRGAGST